MSHVFLFQLLGGLGFFLFGIRMMSEGLRKVSSDRLKNIIKLLTRNRILALLVGTGVTALIQSSSAMTVMVVGFINAGLLSLKQAIPIVLGNKERAYFFWKHLLDQGVFSVMSIAPAVPVGKDLVRTAMSARHTDADFEIIEKALRYAVKKM